MLQPCLPVALSGVQAKPVKLLSAPHSRALLRPLQDVGKGAQGGGRGRWQAAMDEEDPAPVPPPPPRYGERWARKGKAQKKTMRMCHGKGFVRKGCLVCYCLGHLLTKNYMHVYLNDLGNAFITCSKLSK